MSGRIRRVINVGDRSGRLTVIENSRTRDKMGRLLVRCKCDCGNEVLISRGRWLCGERKSCGCIQREKESAHDLHLGDRVGKLVIIEEGLHKGKLKAYKCRCDCGNVVVLSKGSLLSTTISCGCERKRIAEEGRLHKVSFGSVFGRLTVLDVDHCRDKRGNKICLCSCSCGKNNVLVPRKALVCGDTKSCGCLLVDHNLRHGMAHTRLYRIWKGMRDRCNNNRSSYYKWYGAVGIKVCEEWNDFTAFKAWADANGYADDLSIDRIDPKGNYSPENCRWATVAEQNRNKRTTPHIEFEGKSMTCAEWEREKNLGNECLRRRLQAGWPLELAMNTPSGKTRGWLEREGWRREK